LSKIITISLILLIRGNYAINNNLIITTQNFSYFNKTKHQIIESDDSMDNSYYSYEYININIGYSLVDDLELSIISKRIFINIS
jgi:hypothetical protein